MNAPHSLAARCHPHCIACGLNPAGLGLSFRFDGADVISDFDCGARYQGYPGRLHGGVIATLLDSAMTHCLFELRIEAYTGSLEIRYRHPVETGIVAEVRARVRESCAPLYVLDAEIRQGGVVRASARAKFMMKPR